MNYQHDNIQTVTTTFSVPIYNLLYFFVSSLTDSPYSNFFAEKMKKIKTILKVYYMLKDITLKNLLIIIIIFNKTSMLKLV